MPAAKKKKTASNARGFATTSVASQTKREQLPSEKATSTQNTSRSHTAAVAPATPGPDAAAAPTAEKDLKDLSPDELEARLEASELRQVVDEYAVKVRREASRQVTRLETEKRLLRGQAEFLSTAVWLSDHLRATTLESIREENVQLGSGLKASPVSDETVLGRIWALQNVLQGIQIPQPVIDQAVRFCLTIQSDEDSNAMIWGLNQVLEWLPLHADTSYLPEYDSSTPLESGPEVIEDDEAITRRIQEVFQPQKKALKAPVAKTAITDNGKADIEVSDSEDDLEPDEMLAKHLQYKLRLLEHDPELYGEAHSKSQQKPEATKGQTRLLNRIALMTKDPLFDADAAEVAWRVRRAQAFRDQADRRRLGLATVEKTPAHPQKSDLNAATDTEREAEAMAAELLKQDNDAEGGLFEGMFDTPQEPSHTPAQSYDPSSMITRHFPNVTGTSPKRVLEEACKARDSSSKVTTKLTSPTTYHARHSVLIQWSKGQPSPECTGIERVNILTSARTFLLEMDTISAQGADQSEGYACTAAFFAVFSGSQKEEKASLRLPVSFRDLYTEFVTAKKNDTDANDRLLVKQLKSVLQDHKGKIEEQDVVLRSASKNRSRRGSGTSPPNGTDQVVSTEPVASDHLKEIWARKTDTLSYKRMLQGRQSLPMYHFREQALDIVRNNQVTILCGETGCGKSTQMPASILEDQLSRGLPCRIYCTEPRRISAVSLAQRVSEELGEPRGSVGTTRSLVGYAIRLESQTAASTRLVYATVGIVLRMLESLEGLDDLTHLIIDEVHERSIDTDFLLIVLQSLLGKRPDLKVVLMSATVDAERFSKYLGNAPIISVPGRTFPVKAYFLEDAIEMTGYKVEERRNSNVDEDDMDPDMQKASLDTSALGNYSKSTIRTLSIFDEYRIDYTLIVRLLEQIARQPALHAFSKAVLIFLPGIGEIRQLTDMLSGHPGFAQGWLLYPLHSTFSNEEQQAAFQIPPKGMRKIVLATNIAETGITIPDVTCVIDTGKHKEMRFDERRQLSRLIQSFISRANAKQRRGRAGRVQEGICFHLFTKQRHDKMMIEQQVPEMLRLSLQDLVIRVKICKLGDIEPVLSQALDPPSARNIRRAIDALIEVGALTSGEALTSLGQQIAKLPLDAQLGKLIILGSQFGCLDFALTTAAIASSKSPFVAPMGAKRQADTVRLGFRRGDSDLLTAFNAYVAWRRVCTSAGISEFEFCNKNFLSTQNLSNIEELKGQLLSSLADARLVDLSPEERSALSCIRHSRYQRAFISIPASTCNNEDNDTLVDAVIAWSFYPKILVREGKGWRSIANNQSLSLHPTSVNKLSPSPAFVKSVAYLSFYSIMQSNSRFTNAQETSPVDPLALVLFAGDARFDFYAGVVVVDGNRLRFKVRRWTDLLVIKALRARIRKTLARAWKEPGREMSAREKMWFDVLVDIFRALNEKRIKDAL